MRQMRLTIALLFALTLAAQGLFGHVSMAHRLAAASATADSCIPSRDDGDKARGHTCLSHCLAAATVAMPPPPDQTAIAAPVAVFAAVLRPVTVGFRLTHVLPRDHAPRAPPVRA